MRIALLGCMALLTAMALDATHLKQIDATAFIICLDPIHRRIRSDSSTLLSHARPPKKLRVAVPDWFGR